MVVRSVPSLHGKASAGRSGNSMGENAPKDIRRQREGLVARADHSRGGRSTIRTVQAASFRQRNLERDRKGRRRSLGQTRRGLRRSSVASAFFRDKREGSPGAQGRRGRPGYGHSTAQGWLEAGRICEAGQAQAHGTRSGGARPGGSQFRGPREGGGTPPGRGRGEGQDQGTGIPQRKGGWKPEDLRSRASPSPMGPDPAGRGLEVRSSEAPGRAEEPRLGAGEVRGRTRARAFHSARAAGSREDLRSPANPNLMGPDPAGRGQEARSSEVHGKAEEVSLAGNLAAGSRPAVSFPVRNSAGRRRVGNLAVVDQLSSPDRSRADQSRRSETGKTRNGKTKERRTTVRIRSECT